jgi:putative membrane protein
MDAIAMSTLAEHWDGPGPWILFLPLVWAAVVAGFFPLLRRRAWRGHPMAHREQSPIAVLGRRFAAGEIDEDEYWRRLSVLDEQFGSELKSGTR